MNKIASLSTAQKVGWTLMFLGVIAGVTTAAVGVFEGLLAAVIYLGPGAFLAFSPAPTAYFAARKLKKAQQSELNIQQALRRLEESSGAQSVIAYDQLHWLVTRRDANGAQRLADLLESIKFDMSRLDSKLIGSLTNVEAGVFATAHQRQIRIYKDWVIAGDLGYDFDISTRGSVNVDGSVTFDKNNRPVDMRVATLQLATQEWSHAFRIDPNQADEARRILNQLAAIVDEMKPKGVTAADIHNAMERLIGASGKSPAEKLEELSNLRYQRLLSDQEFEAAKSKILGI